MAKADIFTYDNLIAKVALLEQEPEFLFTIGK
jgi:hypothetical protein